MIHRYRRFARNTYRFLRNRKRRRENRLFGWLGKRVLNRDVWKPERHAVASGVAIGLAVSMLPPIPIQMLLAVIIAVLLHANIPSAAAACWFSNPFTWGPILVAQKSIGDWMLRPGSFDALHPHVHTLRCTALGAVVLVVVLAPLGFVLVYALWDAVRWTARRALPVAAKKFEPVVKVGRGEPESSSALATTQIDP
jgi:uncharacterized protein (DUF2062 family)